MMAQNKGGSALLKTEDWLAVWLGFLIIILVLVFPGLRPEMPKFRWATDAGFAATVDENRPAVQKLAKDATAKGEADLAAAGAGPRAPLGKAARDKGDRAAIGGAAKKVGDAAKAAKDAGLKKTSADVGRKLSGDAGALVGKVFSGENIWNSIKLGIAFWILSTIGIAQMGAAGG